jgi:hypothetical protein
LGKSPSFVREQRRRIIFNPNHGFLKNSFKKGNIPNNKGKKMEDWISSPEAIKKIRATQYKPGNKPRQTKYDGAISIRTDNGDRKYKYIRISECKWAMLHRYVWTTHRGDIPNGYNIVFKDGNTMNCEIENLECISNEELMQRNTLHNYPEELQTAIITKNKILKKIKNYGKKQN